MSEPTPREREVLELVADGLSNEEVAGRLGIDYDESGMERVSVPHCVNAHDSYDNRACDRGEAEFWRGWMLYRKAFRATLTMKVDGGKEIDAVAGLTVLFEENGAEKNLTNFEMTGEKGVLCGELGPLLGYIPGLVVKTDDARHRVEIRFPRAR